MLNIYPKHQFYFMAKSFGSGTTIPLVFGFGLTIILIGTLLNQLDPNFPGHLNVDYESAQLYAGQWFMLAGFVTWIALVPILLWQKSGKGRNAALKSLAATRSIGEDIPDFFTRNSTWLNIIVFGVVGLIGYFGVTQFVPEGYSRWAEIPFVFAFISGFSLLVWRLFFREDTRI